LLAAGLVWAASPSQAVHDNSMFELDGNTVHNSATTPPWDWNSLFDASGNRLVTPDPDNGPLLASTFVSDAAVPDQSYFTSNKDIQPIASGQQHWGCDPINNPLDKDDLLNAYAALVQVPANAPDNAGHTVLYLGSERGSNNGTSFAGFWLLKDKSVGCSGSSNFSGQHTDGDLLIVSDYTNGGGTQDVSVYRWNGNDATGSLSATPIITGAICSLATVNDPACAIANSATITTPWSPTSHQSNTFVETGIDMTTLLGQSGGCFTTFLAETRSSAELTATLKDFAGGQFNTCAPPPITTTATPGGSLNAPGAAQHDEATVSAVGNRPTPTGTVKFYLCQPNQVTAAGCPVGSGTLVSTNALNNGAASSATVNGSSTPNDNALGKYCWRAEYTPDAAASGFYVPSTHTNATTECFTIAHAAPTIATQIAVGGDNPPGLGFTTLGDTATLSGFIGTVTGETVTFKLYGPYANGVTPTCTGSPVFTTTGTLNASGVASTSQTYAPTAAGTYVWVASYPGDTLNDGVTGKCTDANESATIVGAQIDVAKSANPPGPVTAGDTIGFDITVSNSGAVPATGVTVTDTLPAKADGAVSGDLNWSLDPAYSGCSITGAVGSQVLNCNVGTVAANSTVTPVIHVKSSTSPVDCGVVSNKATVATTNGTGGDSDVAHVTVLCPSLTLTKTADDASVDAGQQIGFTVTAGNAGPGIARNVVIDDPLPSGAGVDWTIASGPANCSIQGSAPNQTLHCTTVDLAAGQSESVHVVSGTAYASCKAYPNTASLTTTNGTSLEANATTTVRCAALTLTKTADASVVDAGAPIGFTVTATNSSAPGTGTAHGVVIDDPLPSGAGIDWSIASGPANCSIQGSAPNQTLHCAAVDLAPGAGITVHVTSNTSFQSCSTLPNTVSLTATNHPSLEANASTRVACAKLTLTKTADNATVNAGEQIGFVITASNSSDAGTGTAHSVVIDDPLPSGAGIDWSIASGPANCSIQGSPPNETLHCTAVDLAPGASISVHVTSNTSFQSCAALPNTASLTATNHPSVEASATTTVQCPALDVVKTADAASVSAGSSIGFTIAVSNGGPGTADAVTLSDALPAGSGVDWSISPAYAGPGTCSITGAVGSEVLGCSFGDLAAGATVSVHVTSATSPASCQAYPNSATASAANAPNATDNAITAVLCPDVSLVKTADADAVDAGEQIGFTITAGNSGGQGVGTAVGVVIDDPLPGGSGISWSIDSGPANCSIQGSPPNQTLHCAAVDLAPGATESVHVVSSTTFQSCAGLVNVATLTGSNVGVVGATAVTTVQCPSVTLIKTADAASVDAGNPIGFTVTVSNGGPGEAKDVVVDDPLPSGDGIDWSVDAGPANCTITGDPGDQTLHCTAVTLASGQSEVIHVVSDTAFASCAAYDNTATVTASNSPSPEPASATTTVQCPELTLTKTADAAMVDAGDQIGFVVTVTNGDAEGTGTAHGVVIDDPLPAGSGVDWSIASGPENCSIQGSPPDETLHCTAVDLGPGESLFVHVVSGTAFASCAAYPNTAYLTATNHPSLQAGASTTVRCPSLTVLKTADDATVSSGDTIGFTLTVSNGGPGTAKSVVLTDALPSGAGVNWSIDPASGACQITGAVGDQVLDCAFGDLASGAVVAVHVISQTTLESCTTYPNTGVVSATNHPQVTDSADTTVQCPNVSLTKTADAELVNAGEQVGFTVTATNSDAEGTGTAKGVVIDDPLPGGPGVDWSIDSGPENCSITGTAPDQALKCSAVDLAPGESETVHVVSDTAFVSCAIYDNTASLTLTNGVAPDDASASTSVQCPNLAVTKTADAVSVEAGKPIGFVITVSNSGPGTAVGATLTDPLPAGKGVSWAIDDAGTSAAGCSISGGADGQVLDCELGDLEAGAVVEVHVLSDTTDQSCARYPNVATVDAENAPPVTAVAGTRVISCLGIQPTSAPPTGPVAVTGAGRLDLQLELVALLIGGGIVLLLVGRRRRHGRHG
jgi:uncharacterized repeat protein (TIGR01451 family)